MTRFIKKTFLACIFAILFSTLCILCLPTTAFRAEATTPTAKAATVLYSGTCGTNLRWQIDDAGTLTIDGTGRMNTYFYGSAPWYSHGNKITKIIVNNGITYISDYAFCECDRLEEITLPFVGNTKDGTSTADFGYIFGVPTSSNGNEYVPESLRKVTITGGARIKEYAFGNCYYLTSVTIPDSVTEISYYAFENCSSLTSITIGDSVTSIGKFAFSGCSSLTSITIPDSVTEIGLGAFSRCESLKEITLPFVGNTKDGTSNTHFGYIFGPAYYSTSNKNEYVPESLRKVTITGGARIKAYAFENCYYLTSVTIPDSVTSIGGGAFYLCIHLQEITLPFVGNTKDGTSNTHFGYIFGVTTSSDKNEYVPKNLRKVTITGGAKINGSAFKNCYYLTSVTIPDSVTSIGGGAFYGCSRLEEITLPFVGNTKDGTSNTHFGYIFGASSFKDNYDYVPKNLRKVAITGDVTSISDYAFYNCYGLTSINIPNSVTSIGDYAFHNCSSLTSVTIGDSVTSIGDYAFCNCQSFTSITIPDSVTSIGDYAFSYCSGLTSVTIPDSVTSISNYAFYNCSGLTSVTIPNSVASIGKNAFCGCKSLTSVTIPDSVTSIGDYAFDNCSGLTSVIIPNSVTSISNYAFRSCSSLTSIIIPDSVTSISNYAFSHCSSLRSITIPDSVTSIGDYAFYYCSSLRSITIPDSVTNIGIDSIYKTGYYNNLSNWKNGVLYQGNHLIDAETSLSGAYNIKNGTKVIAARAFYDCNRLTSVTIPDSVTNICHSAFYNCQSLANVTIPNSVTRIDEDSFFGCNSLSSITFESYITEIYDDSNTIHYGATIYFYPGSTADAYATKYGRTFVELVCLHSFTKQDKTYIKSEATCTSPAIYYKSCEICCKKGTETFKYGSVIPHDYGNWIIRTHATTTTDGEKYRVCSKCADEETRKIPKGKIVLGDADGNSFVSATDLICFQRYLANWKSYDGLTNTYACDINDDGEANHDDAVILARHLAGWKAYKDLSAFSNAG